MTYRIREATVADAPVLARHRRAMFEAMGMLGAPPGTGSAGNPRDTGGAPNGDRAGEARRGQGDALEVVSRGWIARELAAGTFYSWVVEVDEADSAGDRGDARVAAARMPADPAVVAGGGLQVRPLMPRPGHLRGEPEALILSMWTEPPHRGRGLATRVVEAMLAWCRARGIRRVTLHASEMGRPIYERLGFKATNEMRLEL